MGETGRVLVLGTGARNGLVAVRSLGRHGLRVTAGSERQVNPGGWSRHSDRSMQFPSPETETEGFVRAVEREVVQRDYDLLLPVPEACVVAVSKHLPRLTRHTNVPFQEYDDLLVGLDKLRTFWAARAAGVPTPETVSVTDPGSDTYAGDLAFPVVVKPRRGNQRVGVTVCHTAGELERVVPETVTRHGPVILQEYVPNGGECGVYTVYDRESRLCGATVQRRLRTNPPEGGPSTYRKTVHDPGLLQLGHALLTSIDWMGPAMVEFRIDARTGEPKLLEVNPRLWGSLALTVHAGVDVPVILYRLAVGDQCDGRLAYRSGVSARWLFGDLQQPFLRRDRLTALREVVGTTFDDCAYDVLSWSDPLPAVAYGLNRMSDRLG